MKIRKGDMVQVMVGKDKGKRGKVLRVLENGRRVTVEKINIVKRHTKAQNEVKPGGIVEKEAPVSISNVMLVDAKLGRPVRVNFRVDEVEGKRNKVRFSRKHDATLD
ncbi:MAG: 50S ribosomal protein L24 [Deltaproteobacteria bacterium]|nr:50S ribosomal protein L24 [Deltaproteobacteria bacterium]